MQTSSGNLLKTTLTVTTGKFGSLQVDAYLTSVSDSSIVMGALCSVDSVVIG